jgi:flavin reductase (DIM6/NTAB) family NADH-FMN oxidoreductase RutF
MHISLTEIQNLDQRYRATLINSLAGFKTAVLVGTQSKKGHTNLGLFNSLIHLGANPALYGLLFRPESELRDTLHNILETGCYTLNYVSIDQYQKAHQTSARYDAKISEFDEIGFTAEYLNDFSAPFVEEAVVKIAMKFEQKIDLAINGTSLVIGSLQHINVQDFIIEPDGFVALDQMKTLGCIGLDAYFSSTRIDRLPYAKPKSE